MPAPGSSHDANGRRYRVEQMGSSTLTTDTTAAPSLAREHNPHRRTEDGKAQKRFTSQPSRLRRIPTPPHRQLFLVDGYYCGADPNEGEEDLQSLFPTAPRFTTNAQRRSTAMPTGDAGPLNTANDGNKQRQAFYVPPSVPLNLLLPNTAAARVAGRRSSLTPGQSPSPAFSPTPEGATNPTVRDRTQISSHVNAGAAGGRRSTVGSRPIEKLRVKRRLYEPVELQVESLSAFIMRLTLFLWYACLIVALVLEVIPQVQWSMTNICGPQLKVDVRRMERFTSPCVSSSAMGDGTTNVALTWTGNDLDGLHSRLVRYRRLAISLPIPSSQTAASVRYPAVATTTMLSGGVSWVSEYDVQVHCLKKRSRCDVVRVPEDVLEEANSGITSYTFVLKSLPAAFGDSPANGAIGIAFQRRPYTMATIVWRYVLMFLSLMHVFRFIAFRKFTSALYEQSWTLALQVALIWYLDPLFALNIINWPMPAVLSFLEFRIPTYFVAVMMAYMLSVMSASMAWPTAKPPEKPRSLIGRVITFLQRSRNVYDPPMWTKIMTILYLVSVFVLDISDACVEQLDWYAASNSNVRFKRLYWAVIALLLFGALVSLMMLVYLRNYLGDKPYLESRPQQLACRVFIMIFLSAVVYYILHCLVFFLLYNRHYPALASQQPFLQLPALMTASFFVNIMTLVYTSQNRDDNVPIHPKDPRWKYMVWPDTWYRWLARHGGSQYIFNTEVEETRFYRLQFEFRQRQFMAKQKRKQRRGGTETLDGTINGLATQDGTRSGLLPVLRQQPSMDGYTTRIGTTTDVQAGRWRSNVWDSPMPSRPTSPSRSRHGGDEDEWEGEVRVGEDRTAGEREEGGVDASRRVVESQSGSYEPDLRIGTSSGTFTAQHSTIALQRAATTDGGAFAVGDTVRSNSALLRHSRSALLPNVRSSGMGGGQATPIRLAARHVLNMDRFSTYFLADDPKASSVNAGAGGSAAGAAAASSGTAATEIALQSAGAACATRTRNAPHGATAAGGGRGNNGSTRAQSQPVTPQREATSSGFDALDIEGPARRATRLRRTQSGAADRRAATLSRRDASGVFEDHYQRALNRRTGDVSDDRYPANYASPLLLSSAGRPLGGTMSGSDYLNHSGSGAARRPGQHRTHRGGGVGDSGALSNPTQQFSHPPIGALNAATPTLKNGTPALAAQPVSPPLPPLRREVSGTAATSITGGAKNMSSGAQRKTQKSPQPAHEEVFLQALRAMQPHSSDPPGYNERLEREGRRSSSFAAAAAAVGEKSDGTMRKTAPAAATSNLVLPRFAATSTTADPPSTQLGAQPRAVHVDTALQFSHSEDDIASDLSARTSESGYTTSTGDVSGTRSNAYGEGNDDGSSDSCGSLNDDQRGSGKGGRRRQRGFFGRLNVMREHLGAVMGAAERNLFERPARGLDRLEMQIFDAAYRPFQSMNYLPFFNLETAIDCYNLSWEAYGVEKSVGDEVISTGIEVKALNVPQTVAHGVKKVLCGCCAAEDDDEEEEEEDEDEDGQQTNDTTRIRMPATASAAVPPAASAGPTTAHEMTSVREGSGGGRGDKKEEEEEEQVHVRMDGEMNQDKPVARTPRTLTPQENAQVEEAAVTSSPNAAAASAPVDPALYPINVEKYGFELLLVAEAKEVQVIMARMDTAAPEHVGKAPRIIIGFRGTANLSNAKYDINIHRVVWREMEQTAAAQLHDGENGTVEREEEGGHHSNRSIRGASIDAASSVGSQNLGCGACLRSCSRATSWRPTCHAGFLSIWKTLKPTVLRRLVDVLREDSETVYRIFTTGHSLGGALASLSAYSITSVLQRMDYPIPEVTVYTYGQPRIGNRTFQRVYNKAVPRSFRVVNESDVIVTMTMFGGYHVGIEVDMDRNGNFIVKPTEIEKLFPPTTGRGLALINHLMTNYGISMNAIATRTRCPARGLGCYITADPEKIATEKAKEEAMKLAVKPKNSPDPPQK